MEQSSLKSVMVGQGFIGQGRKSWAERETQRIKEGQSRDWYGDKEKYPGSIGSA